MNRTQVMLKFFFYLILALVIFIPVVAWGCKFLNLGDTKQSESYNELVNIINSIGSGEMYSIPVYLNKKSIIVGFVKDADRFENYFRSSLLFYFDRPEGCEDNKTCICLCPDYDFTTTGNEPYSKECEKPRCVSIDTVDFIPETHVFKRTGYLWKGGFLYARELSVTVNGLESKNILGTRAFYVEKYGDIVGVCLQNPGEVPCIPEEIKEEIDASEVVEQPDE
jgi:hypothetical protein